MAFVAFFWFEKNLAVLTSEQGYVVNLVFVSIPRKEKRIVFRLFYFIFKVLWKFTSVFSKPLVPHKVCIDNCHHRSVCNPGYNWKEKTWAINQIGINRNKSSNCPLKDFTWPVSKMMIWQDGVINLHKVTRKIFNYILIDFIAPRKVYLFWKIYLIFKLLTSFFNAKIDYKRKYTQLFLVKFFEICSAIKFYVFNVYELNSFLWTIFFKTMYERE